MQTQVKVQMDERDQHGQPPPNVLQAPGQQMMGQSAYGKVILRGMGIVMNSDAYFGPQHSLDINLSARAC